MSAENQEKAYQVVLMPVFDFEWCNLSKNETYLWTCEPRKMGKRSGYKSTKRVPDLLVCSFKAAENEIPCVTGRWCPRLDH